MAVCVGLHQFFPLRALAFVRFLRAAFFRHGAGLSPCRRTCALLVSSAVSSSAPCSVVCWFFRLPGVGPCWFCFASCLVLQERRGFSASPSIFGARLWLVRLLRSCGFVTDGPVRPSRLIRPHPSCLACATTCVAAPAMPHARCFVWIELSRRVDNGHRLSISTNGVSRAGGYARAPAACAPSCVCCCLRCHVPCVATYARLCVCTYTRALESGCYSWPPGCST